MILMKAVFWLSQWLRHGDWHLYEFYLNFRHSDQLPVLEEMAITATQEMIDEWKKQPGKVINPKSDLSQLIFKMISSLVCE